MYEIRAGKVVEHPTGPDLNRYWSSEMAVNPLNEALDGVIKFGRLTVLREAEPKVYGRKKHRQVYARCDCDSVIIVSINQLRKNGARSTKSCGCLRVDQAKNGDLKITHGHARAGAPSPEYRTWQSMKTRCGNPKHPKYANYGGRGITVCQEWAGSFEQFLADMGKKPHPRMSIDRIDNEQGYKPGNCRWATYKEQSANQRR